MAAFRCTAARTWYEFLQRDALHTHSIVTVFLRTSAWTSDMQLCNLTLLRTKELKGDEWPKWASKLTATETACTVYASDSSSTMLFCCCFQWRWQCHCDKKMKACGGVTFLLFRSSRRQHEVQAASLRHGGVLLFVCMSVCGGGCLSCPSLLVIVFVVIYCCRRLRQVNLRHNDDIKFLVSLFTGNVGHASTAVYSALLTVYSALSATRVHSRKTRVHYRQWSQRSVTDIPSE